MARRSREEAVAMLEEGRRRLEELFAQLSPEDLERPATIGDGAWSAKDLMGHVAFWQELAIESLAAWRAGVRPSVEDVFARGAEGIDEANARNQERTSIEPVEEVRRRAAAAHAEVLAAIGGISDAEWTSKAPYETDRRRTLGELLGSVLGAPKQPFAHAFAHLPDLEAYVASRP